MIRVMIVDDDKLARLGLETMLPWNRYGMAVVGDAANGAKALELLEDVPVDLLFVDLEMPIMSGLDFIKAARVRYPSLQFVVLTFHEDFACVQAALRLGVLDYISKLELENADYDAICARLAKKFPQRKQAGQRGEREAMPEEPWPQWRQELYALRWLYDYAALDRLLALISEAPVSPFALERMIVRAVLLVENQTALRMPTVPELRDERSAADFLRAFRDDVLERASKSQDLHRLSICLLKTVAYVRGHLHGNLHTEFVASRVALSRPYFSSSFSRIVGISFHSYVRRERVLLARKLLEGGLSVSETATSVGYEDVRSFTKMFQEQMGETPAAFQQRIERMGNL